MVEVSKFRGFQNLEGLKLSNNSVGNFLFLLAHFTEP